MNKQGAVSKVAGFPAGIIASIDCKDYHDFREQLPGWKLEHQVLGRTPPRIKACGFLSKTVQVGLIEHASGFSVQGMQPAGSVGFSLRVDVTRPMIFRGCNVDGLEMAVTSGGNGFEVIHPSGALFLTACLSRQRLDEYADIIYGGHPLLKHHARRLHFVNQEAYSRFVFNYRLLLRDITLNSSLLNSPDAASMIEEKLFEITVLQNYSMSSTLDHPNRHHAARAARRYVIDNLDEAISIRTLCEVTRASFSTLERGFQELYGISPLSYIKTVRLARAREELTQPNAETRVTDVALRWGFLELGRFSQYYFQMYRETPRQTLFRARGFSS